MGEYKVIISYTAQKHLFTIQKSGDKSSIKKVEKIIAELHIHPEIGVGNPERLKFELSGLWSRRINQKDRLIYKIEDEIVTVTIISALGHYGDR